MSYYKIQDASIDEVRNKIPPTYKDEICILKFDSKPDDVYVAAVSGFVINALEKSYTLQELEKEPWKELDEKPSKVVGNENLIEEPG
jgi:hypothetical protein